MTTTNRGKSLFATTCNLAVAVPDLSVTTQNTSKTRVKCIIDRRELMDVERKDQFVMLSINGMRIAQKLKKVTIVIGDQTLTGLGFETEDNTAGLVHYQVFVNKGAYGPGRAIQVEEI